MQIICHNLSKVYNQGKNNEVKALRDIDLEIVRGEMCAVIGPSGSGKTTLLRMIGCLDTPTNGKCSVSGVDTHKSSDKILSQLRNEQLGFVLQEFGLIDASTVYENIRVPLLFSRKHNKNTKEKIDSLLKKFNIYELRSKPVSKLSGGQKQRVAIARALVNDPSIILADEPTGALDSATAQDVMTELKELNHKGKTIIIVTHNASVAEQCGRVLNLVDGRLT
jgi:putative ABC transport system ATP-binding protein